MKPHLRSLTHSPSLRLLAILLILFFIFEQRKSLNSYMHHRPIPNHPSHSLPSRRDWHASAPSFCPALARHPQPAHPRDPNCTSSTRKHAPCDPARPALFAQDGEDFYLYTHHFAHLQRPGVYADVATNDPIDISNTYFLDRCLGWQGVCVEANGRYHEPIHRLRSCHLVPTCVSDRDGATVEFALSGAVGGILETHKHANATMLRERSTMEMKRCTDMRSVTSRLGVRKVDYLNVDVEGHELQVLQGWDWDHVEVAVATVELSHENRKAVVRFMTGKGFKTHWSGKEGGFYMNDPVWVHENVVWGKPE